MHRYNFPIDSRPVLTRASGCRDVPARNTTIDCATNASDARATLHLFGQLLFEPLRISVKGVTCPLVRSFADGTQAVCALPDATGTNVAVVANHGDFDSEPLLISYALPSIARLSSVACEPDSIVDCPNHAPTQLRIEGSNFGKSGAKVS